MLYFVVNAVILRLLDNSSQIQPTEASHHIYFSQQRVTHKCKS